MLDRVQERSWKRALGVDAGLRLRGAQRALAQWAIVDDYNSVLDLRCKDARLLKYLSQKFSLRACGMADDAADARMLREVLPEAEIFCARPEDIPWREACFDAVLCQLNKAEDGADHSFLQEAMRVLKPNGQLLIALEGLPEPLCCAVDFMGMASMEGRVKPRDLMRGMEDAGFEDISYRTVRPMVGLAMGWKRG